MKPPGEFVTSLSLSIGEFDNVSVGYDYQPAEYDTNTAEGAEIYQALWDDGENLLDRMTESEIMELETACIEHRNEWLAGYYDERAEAMAERRRELLQRD